MKAIIHLGLFLAICIAFCNNVNAQPNPSGTIYFVNGTTKTFKSIILMHETPNNNPSEIPARSDGLYVFYQNSYRTVPFSSIKSLIVIPERIISSCIYGQLSVSTKNGINIITPVTICDIDVNIFDELTGGIIAQNFSFALNNVLNITKIEFN